MSPRQVASPLRWTRANLPRSSKLSLRWTGADVDCPLGRSHRHYDGRERTCLAAQILSLRWTGADVGLEAWMDSLMHVGVLIIKSRYLDNSSNIICKFSGGGGTLSRGARSHKTCPSKAPHEVLKHFLVKRVRQVCCTPVFTGNARSPVAFPWPSPPGLDGRGLVTRRAPGGSGRRLH